MRWLAWLALIALVIFAIQKKKAAAAAALRKTRSEQAFDAHESVPTANQAAAAETMLCCDFCQVHFPASEAVYREQGVYCSVSHADQH